MSEKDTRMDFVGGAPESVDLTNREIRKRFAQRCEILRAGRTGKHKIGKGDLQKVIGLGVSIAEMAKSGAGSLTVAMVETAAEFFAVPTSNLVLKDAALHETEHRAADTDRKVHPLRVVTKSFEPDAMQHVLWLEEAGCIDKAEADQLLAQLARNLHAGTDMYVWPMSVPLGVVARHLDGMELTEAAEKEPLSSYIDLMSSKDALWVSWELPQILDDLTVTQTA